MQNVAHYGLVRHLGVVGVGVVDGVVLALAHIRREWLAAVSVGRRVVGLAVMLHKVPDKRVGAGGVVGRVGQGEDVLVRTDREPFDLAKLRVLQLLTQLF
ncbi:MAG: hypothetical protein DDT39_00242 [Firmicutes bacterium]|nr:hypothetical protein [candidate division NPL-UPA2 bacterium]